MTVPDWVQDAVFYHIFPDRFHNSQTANDPVNIQPWGSEPTIRGFQGGDLRGITDKLPYLLDLGINAIYLNPIFSSSSNHRYHTNDYYEIDPTLGTIDDFHDLLDKVHSHNMHLILDGVFNHSGRGFFAFNDILENNAESRYKDWYYVNGFPLDAFSDGEATRYEAWWSIKALPKFNTKNPAVREYLMKVTRYWIEQGADGWRLDVPGEIDDDSFWAEFRQVVKAANPDAYTVGEIWEVNPRWVGDQHFDGLMHYPWRVSVLDMLRSKITIAQYAEQVEGYINTYPRENVFAMYIPLGSHDTKRLFTKLKEDVARVKLAMLLQFTYPGAPGIYYGDEIGMAGEKDPFNRRAFPWSEDSWNREIRSYEKDLVALRKKLVSLRRGEYLRVFLDEEVGAYAFARKHSDEVTLVVINARDSTSMAQIPVSQLGWGDQSLVDQVGSAGAYPVKDGVIEVRLPPWSGVILAQNT